MASVRKQTIPTEQPPHAGEVSAIFCGQRNGFPRSLISIFQTRSRYFSSQVFPQLSSRGRVDPVPDPLLLRKSVSPGIELWISESLARNSDH
jgi:hypothetical protein